MADLIKFKCKCGKKIGVRSEYAGKKAKCPGCSQPIRVPSPRPKRAAAASGAPVVAAGGRGFLDDGGSSNSNALFELAEMEKNAESEVAEMTSRLGARAGIAEVTNGKDCPGCGTMVKQEAVVCVHCGYNYDTGKRLKTKKRKAEKDTSVVGTAANYSSSSGGGTLAAGLNNIGTICAGALFCVMGIGAIFYDWDLSETSSRKGRWVASLFNTLGPTATGCILIGVGICVGIFGLVRSSD